MQLDCERAFITACDERRTGRAVGKAILVGEHFVVHGAPALAIPVWAREVRVTLGALDANAGPPHPEAERTQRAVMRMLEGLGVPHIPRDTVHVGGSLPLGAGLGGSAAVAAALGRALQIDEDALPAFVHTLEAQAHGRPSGVDGAVVCREEAIWFEPGGAAAGGVMTRVVPHPAVNAALWIAVVPREGTTRDAVAAVAQWRGAAEAAFQGLLAEARADAVAARHAVEVGDIIQLGELFSRAHARLTTVGVSNAALDTLVTQARDRGAWGAKLSGAGLGGAVLALAPPDVALDTCWRQAGATEVLHPTRPGRSRPPLHPETTS